MGKKNRWKRAACLTAAALLGITGVLSGCGKGQTDGVKAEETVEEDAVPVAYLGEEPVYLDEAVFYTRMLQEQWEYAYYQDFGSEMWQMEAGEDGQTLEEVLKNDVMSLLTELHLLCSYAEEYGAELTDEERETIAGRAEDFMESNTPAVLEAAGATAERVERYLSRNELAAKTAELIQEGYDPEISEEEAAVGKLTYALFSVTGTYDGEGNYTPFTDEEKEEIRQQAEDFAARATELGDITAAGEEASHTVIDAYFNDSTNGGAHPDVAEAVRGMETGQVSEPIETEDGWYIVQRVSDYDESATQDNLDSMTEQAKEAYLMDLEAEWEQETPLVIEEEVWSQVRLDEMLTE